jgi:hypothetical protein
MALAFATARLRITNETGAHEDTVTAAPGFDLPIREDDHQPVVGVAIQSFKLDLAGSADPTDIVQVTTSIDSVSGRSVSVRFKTDYTGGPYSGEVKALVIADLIEP